MIGWLCPQKSCHFAVLVMFCFVPGNCLSEAIADENAIVSETEFVDDVQSATYYYSSTSPEQYYARDVSAWPAVVKGPDATKACASGGYDQDNRCTSWTNGRCTGYSRTLTCKKGTPRAGQLICSRGMTIGSGSMWYYQAPWCGGHHKSQNAWKQTTQCKYTSKAECDAKGCTWYTTSSPCDYWTYRINGYDKQYAMACFTVPISTICNAPPPAPVPWPYGPPPPPPKPKPKPTPPPPPPQARCSTIKIGYPGAGGTVCCPPGMVVYGDGSACEPALPGGGQHNCALYGNTGMPQCS